MRAAAGFFLLIGLATLASCGKGKGPPQAPLPEVGVVTAQPQTVPLTRDLVGRLSAYRSADVRARVAGVLLKRVYKEGSEVEAGQLLFRIDPAPLKAALDNARAQLAQAQAGYTNAHVAAERARALAPKGYVSKADLDAALANERSAKAAVQAAQAGVETARINLGYADVTSPIDGRAGQQQVTEGALVGNGAATLLTTVDQIDPLYVNFTLSVGELDRLRQAQHSGDLELSQPDKATVKVSLPDGTPYPEAGTVDFSSTVVDPATGAVNLRALLPNPQHNLLPGSYVTLEAMLGERRGAFLIPQPAVQRDTSGAYVLIVGKDGKVARRDVVTSGMDGTDWIVTSGLSAGDEVIASGVQVARPGSPARAVPWQPPAASSGGAATSAPMHSANGG
ncbi:MAG: RND efflux system, membrane fusion protein [Rhodanobacteraceae bacterium]|jgi:membrane fusion protein (multidrug efflux system)|nr:MAG: RND efflux system, membrane fusion protein [Rhodanobacteraceae bacterium]